MTIMAHRLRKKKDTVLAERILKSVKETTTETANTTKTALLAEVAKNRHDSARSVNDLVATLTRILANSGNDAQLREIASQISAIPAPKDVDLQPVIDAMPGKTDLQPVIDALPKEIDLQPLVKAMVNMEAQDMAPYFERLEGLIMTGQKIPKKKKLHTFEVIREPINGLIEKIVVTES